MLHELTSIVSISPQDFYSSPLRDFDSASDFYSGPYSYSDFDPSAPHPRLSFLPRMATIPSLPARLSPPARTLAGRLRTPPPRAVAAPLPVRTTLLLSAAACPRRDPRGRQPLSGPEPASRLGPSRGARHTAPASVSQRVSRPQSRRLQ